MASTSQTSETTSLAIVATLFLILILNFTGELLERYLFFAAVVAPKMPGAPSA
jgi:DMSO reductase anchor subunit